MGFVNSGGLGRALKVGEDCKLYGAVVIPDGVTSLGKGAFIYSYNLTSVVIPNSVTSIGDYAFYNCTNLPSITIPNSVTSIGNSAFGGCTNLPSIIIPNSVTSIGNYTFDSCILLNSVTINAQIITFNSDNNSFYHCTALTTFNVVTGFDPTGLNLSASPITHDSILSIFNKLATIGTAKTITLGATNLAKMSAAEKLIATNKGWTLA